jgi:hypothetical protein
LLERRAFYSGHPALHLSGQLTLFKFVPDEFVPSFWLLKKKVAQKGETEAMKEK